jgi:uracil-DNA glycosylase family 4
VHAEVVTCVRCPRLVAYRRKVAQEKRRAFRDWNYWGKPVPGFGSVDAGLLVVGLAPAAHGGNRTGRVFTGDRSGDWLYAALHRAGFANQPTSTHRDDGLQLIDAYVNAAVRCAPPDNKPTLQETLRCRPFLERELRLLPVRVVVTLGKFAFDAYLGARSALNLAVPRPRPKFGHGAVFDLGDVTLIASYHPSQRNTQTGFLTAAMFDAVFAEAKRVLRDG